MAPKEKEERVPKSALDAVASRFDALATRAGSHEVASLPMEGASARVVAANPPSLVGIEGIVVASTYRDSLLVATGGDPSPTRLVPKRCVSAMEVCGGGKSWLAHLKRGS